MEQQNLEELQKLVNQVKADSSYTQKKADMKNDRDMFNDEFRKIKKEIIWPTLVDIGNELNKLGNDYHIDEEEEKVDATAHAEPSSLQFNLYPVGVDKSFYTPDSTPYIKFYANSYAKMVGIEVSTMMPGQGGSIGTHGEYTLDKITREFVEKEVVSVLKESMVLGK